MKKILVLFVLLVSFGQVCMYAQPIRVGLMLSLQVDKKTRDKNMEHFADFYTGALMSVYEVQDSLHQVELYTFDVGKTAQEMQQVLDSNQLDSLDMIIGPTYPEQVSVISEWAIQHEVFVLLPFASEVPEIVFNPYLLQFNPTEQLEAKELVDDIIRSDQPVRFIFVDKDEIDIPNNVRELQQYVGNLEMEHVFATMNQIMTDSVGYLMRDSVENILLLNSDKYSKISSILPHLDSVVQGKPLRLCSRYAWQKEKVELPQIYTTVFRNNEPLDSVYSARYRKYVARKRTKSYPCYDLLGYDIMTYALQTVQLLNSDMEEGKNFVEIIERPFVGMQSDMEFKRVGDTGGYINRNIHVVRLK